MILAVPFVIKISAAEIRTNYEQYPIGEPQHYPEWNAALAGRLGDPEAVFAAQGFKILRRSPVAVLFERSL